MSPSYNFMALVRAYDLRTPLAADIKEMRVQAQTLLDNVAPLAKTISSLFSVNAKGSIVQQNRFDALLSVAYDVGLDTFFCSPLPDTVRCPMTKTAITSAFLSVPEFDSQLRPELRNQLLSYRIPLLPRRGFEAALFLNNIYFSFGRTMSPLEQEMVYAPYVLHPIVSFMMRG